MFVHNSLVRIRDNHIEKYTSDPAKTARKYTAVHEVARAFGFVAPQVYDTYPDHIVLERIHDIVSLREMYLGAEPDLLDTAVSRAGEVLARLHANLPRVEGVVWSPSPRFVADLRRYDSCEIDISALPNSTLHGDFSFANVFIGKSHSDQIVVIDPCPNFGSTFDEWAVAPVYVDIGKMLACLEGQVSLRYLHRRPSTARVEQLKDCFLTAYEGSGPKLDRYVANAFAFAVASAQFHRRFGLLSEVHRTVLYNRIRGNFPGARKPLSP